MHRRFLYQSGWPAERSGAGRPDWRNGRSGAGGRYPKAYWHISPRPYGSPRRGRQPARRWPAAGRLVIFILRWLELFCPSARNNWDLVGSDGIANRCIDQLSDPTSSATSSLAVRRSDWSPTEAVADANLVYAAIHHFGAKKGQLGHGRLQTRPGFATLRRCGNILRTHQLEEGRPRMEERLQRAAITRLARVSEDDKAE